MTSRVLITGAAGFIGSNLTRRLLSESEYDILAVDKLSYAGNRASLVDVENSTRFHFLQADICDGETMRRAFAEHTPIAVMHLAAESHVDRSIDGPAEFIQTNVVGTYTLLDVAHNYWRQLPSELQPKFRFLHVSTDEVYGSLGPDDPPFSEISPYDPHSPYSATKAASDHLARAWHVTYGLPVLTTNCSNNYGPYQYPEKLIPVAIASALDEQPIPIYGEGKNVRDWLYVEDHTAALTCVLEDGKPGETYNIGGDNELTNIELVETICTLLDELKPRADGHSYRKQIAFVTDRPGHDLRYAINATKIRQELGWRPRQNHETGLRKTVVWYLENEAWWRRILTGEYRLERQGLVAR